VRLVRWPVAPRAALQFLTSHLRGNSGFRGDSGQPQLPGCSTKAGYSAIIFGWWKKRRRSVDEWQPDGVPGGGAIADAGWRRHVTGPTESDAALGRCQLGQGAWGQTPPGSCTVRAACRGPSRVPGTVKPPSRYDYDTNQTYQYQDSAYFGVFDGSQASSAVAC
jgi:hypothetical protein